MRIIKNISGLGAINALGLFCLVLSCCVADSGFAQSPDSASRVTMRIVGEYYDRASVMSMAPRALRDTLAKFFPQVPAEIRPDSGSHYIWSSNGEYLLVRQPVPDSKEYWDRIPATLYDASSRAIWKGITSDAMVVSNNGRNMLGWGEDGAGPALYDISSSEPLKYYNGLDAQFSNDGEYFVGCAGRSVSLFSARGDKMWSHSVVSPFGLDAIISSMGSYVLVDGGTSFPQWDEITGRHKESYFTILRKGGSTVAESTLPASVIHYIEFSPDDGRYAAVSGNGTFVFVKTEPFEVLWTYEYEGGIFSIGLSENGQRVIFGTADMRDGHPHISEYKLFDTRGSMVGHLEVDGIDHRLSFVGGGSYVASWNEVLHRLRLIELSPG